MKDIFARHGIPERLIADNMPFNSLKFKNFASEWKIEVVTSSLHCPNSNGLIERNKQTIKQLLKKVDGSKQDEFLALLEFHSSPISGMKETPQNCSRVGSWGRDLQLLSTFFNQCQVRQQLLSRQRSQKNFYDRGTRPLPELHQGEAVRIQQEREWKPTVVLKQHVASRSYIVGTPDGTQMRRNRVHLQQTKEAVHVARPDLEPVSNEPSHLCCWTLRMELKQAGLNCTQVKMSSLKFRLVSHP